MFARAVPGSMADSIGAILSPSLRRAFRDFRAFLPTQGAVVVAGGIVSLALTLLAVQPAQRAYLQALAEPASGGGFAATMGPYLLLALLAALIGSFSTAAGTALGVVVADALDAGRRPTVAGAWSTVGPRLGNLLLTGLLAVGVGASVIALALGSFFLVVVSPLLLPLAFLLVLGAMLAVLLLVLAWAMALPVAVFERHGPVGNLRRSAQLTRGSRGTIFGVLLVMSILLVVPALLLSLLLGPGFPAASATPEEAIAAMPTLQEQVLLSVVLLPFHLFSAFAASAVLLRLYRDLSQPPAAVPATRAPASADGAPEQG